MIHILITHKESTRFPGKNVLLLPWTIAWLRRAISLLQEPSRVYVAGEYLPGTPDGWAYIPADTSLGHQAVIEEAERVIAPAPEDALALCQLTQPLREPSLLQRAVAEHRGSGKSVISATSLPSLAWRRIGRKGTWGTTKNEDRELYLDGRVYVWAPGHVGDIFSPSCSHSVVVSHYPFICDVNYAQDWPGVLNKKDPEGWFLPGE